jgi:hypothetical protein
MVCDKEAGELTGFLLKLSPSACYDLVATLMI